MWGSTQSPIGGYVPDPLATFLSWVVPWSTTQPPDGFVSVHAFGGNGQFTYKGGGRAYASLNEYGSLKNFVEFLNRAEAEVFFCLSSQARIDDERGGHRRVKRGGRSTENVVRLRSFVLDLDVKPDRYPSQRAALVALLTFCKELGLELGHVVDTGHGIHAYFTLDQPIGLDRWLGLAHQLKAAGQDKGLKFDTNVTVNAATLLRLPSSTNRKRTDNLKPCRVLQQGVVTTLEAFSEALRNYSPAGAVTSGVTSNRRVAQLDPQVFPPRAPITGAYAEHIRAEIDRNRVVTDAQHLYPACPVFADSYDRGGNGDPEPLWYALAKLCHYVEDGRNLFHDLSSEDQRYEEDSTDAKYDTVAKEGWPSCQTFSDSCSAAFAICQKCQFNGKGQSPLNYATRGLVGLPGATPPSVPYVNGAPPGVMSSGGGPTSAFAPVLSHTFTPPNAAYKLIDIPPGFIQLPDCRIMHVADSAMVFETPIYDLELVSMPSTVDEGYEEAVKVVIDRPTANGYDKNEFWFSCKALANVRSLGEAVLGRGLSYKDPALARGMLVDWTSELRKKKGATSMDFMGWVSTLGVGLTGFNYGGYTFTPSGPVPSRIPKSIQLMYTPKGSLHKWKEAAKFLIGRGYVELEVLIATAFAGPLMVFTPEDGGVVFGHSPQSGVGKSAALTVAASVWGMKESGMKGLDTENSAFHRMASLKNLPLFIDELVPGGHSAKKFNEMILAVTSGKEKSRLDRSANDKPFRTWRTLMAAASNYSLTEVASTYESNAQAMRIVEIEVPNRFGSSSLSRGDAVLIRQQLESNFGQAGLVYSDYLGRNHEQVARMVRSIMNDFETQLRCGDGERFWVALSGALIVGASIARKLGLLAFDVNDMWGFLARNVRKQRIAVQDLGVNVDDPLTHIMRLEQFMNEHVRNQIHTKRLPTQGGNRFTREQVSNLNQIENSNYFIARVAIDDKAMLISRSQLASWCKVKSFNFNQMMKVLLKENICALSHHKRSLGGGSQVPTQPAAEYVFEFDLTKPELQGFLP